jgi:hypothetical protein
LKMDCWYERVTSGSVENRPLCQFGAFLYLCPMQNDNSKLHRFVYSPEMVALVSAASQCCSFLEQVKETDGRGFITASVRHLSAVYAEMLRIGETEPVFESAGEPTVTEQDWSAVYQGVAMILGTHNEILRPAEENEVDRSELVPHTISEDLADVYQELKDFTSIYGRGMEELMNDAAWELKERFEEHWGKKLLRSLSALHQLYVTGIEPTAQ